MQDLPDKATLMLAVAGFLKSEVRPAIRAAGDDALAFRVLIAASLCAQAATEVKGEDAQDRAELDRLAELFEGPLSKGLGTASASPEPGADRAERHALNRRLNAELSDRIRRGDVPGELRDPLAKHLMQTLREKLAVSNPRFDLSMNAGEVTS